MHKPLLAALLAAFAVPTAAHAAAFVNGDFEQGPTVGSAGFTAVPSGDTGIAGWIVTGEGIDYVGNRRQAASGTHSIDLNGVGPGGIEQSFDTVAGQTYNVIFSLAGSPEGAPAAKTVLTSATGGFVQTSTFDATGRTAGDMGWRAYSYSFTAAAASSTLSFASQTPGAYGPALDSVSVNAVPEPAIWLMMVFGFFGLGFAVRRRDARPTARVRFT